MSSKVVCTNRLSDEEMRVFAMVFKLYFPALQHTLPRVRSAWPLTKQPLQILMRASFISPQVRARISCIIKSSLLACPAQLSLVACYPLMYKTTLCVCNERRLPAGAACAFPLLCFALYYITPGLSVYMYSGRRCDCATFPVGMEECVLTTLLGRSRDRRSQ
jgi:hypothetical protein